jgi:hypothetical protein
MTEKKAIEIYESLAQPPKSALREIQAGKLKGKTDINPQWRYKAMTESFGLVGIGWKYEVRKLWTEQGAGAEKLAFAQVAVYIKDGDAWSDPIEGIGGSRLVQLEKGAAVSNDEGYKMAVTDAFSTALKMLGVAADIYAGRWDGSKYKEPLPPQVEAVKNAFNGEVVQPKKQPAKLAFEPKGGETTAEEKKELKALLTSNNADGAPIFSKDEMKHYSDMRKDYTAREVIDAIKAELQKRVSPPQQEPAQQSFDNMKPVEQSFDIY